MQKTLLFIALICSIVQISISEYNISESGHEVLIKTADSPSYVNPPKNLLHKGVWKDNFEGASSYVQRAPFYGFLYLIAQSISSSPLVVLKALQYLFMFMGIFLFGKLILTLTNVRQLTIWSMVLFGVLPFFHGFVGYVMTESIAPYLLIAFVYSFVELYRQQKGIIMFTVLGAVIIVFRVQLIIFPIICVIALLIKYRRKMVWTLFLFVPFLFWQLHVRNVMGSFQLHPIYSYSNETIFRPPHQELTNLLRVWEHDGERFHSLEASLRKDTSRVSLDLAMKYVPDEAKGNINNVLALYQKVAWEQKAMWYRGQNRKLEIEEAFVTEARKFEKLHRSDFDKWHYWIYTPTNSLLIKSSHLNQYVFQKTLRGNVFIEIVRVLAVLIICISILMSVLLLFFKSVSIPFRLILFGIVLSLLYLVFFQRMNETRYLSPYLPILFVGFWLFCIQIKKRLIKTIV